MPQTISPQEFVATWRKSTLKERSAAQPHFVSLCRLLGHPTPEEADPSGTWYAFEAQADKQDKSRGYADVWKKNFFAWEYKGKKANLDEAYRQLLQYRESLENPPLLIVSDIESIVIHTNFTSMAKRTVTLTLDDLLTPQGLEQLRNVFFNPDSFRAEQTTAQVTQEASARFAALAQRLHRYGEDPQVIAHFLIRLLFCLFAEDTHLLPENIFTRLVQNTRNNPQSFKRQLSVLFQEMSAGGYFGPDKVRHFNGGLFDDAAGLEMDSDGLDILAEACALDWGNIEPSILGTLFERGLDPNKRSQLGAHYTGREDILLIVEPVLMAPLRRRWAEVQDRLSELTTKRDATTDRSARSRRENEMREQVERFAHELAAVQVLDPACGSGNFLYVALRQLLDLWKEVSVFASTLNLQPLMPLEGSSPHPSQLHGIEINVYAHELAQATIWIGYLQWLRENGYGFPPEPILKPLHNILNMDAILAHDEQGHPIEPEWPQADVIIGNPPFLGGKKMRFELGDTYVDELFALYEGHVSHEADLVCYWFERARALIEASKTKRAGLLATQGIRGGANRRVLERIKETGDIFWAQSDRDWILDGAAVHVSMVAFDNGYETDRELDGSIVEKINSDLTSAVDLSRAEHLKENEGLSFMGVTPSGPFDVPGNLARKWLSLGNNVNGRSNSDVIRPYFNGTDLARRPRDVWIVDFGVTMSFAEATLYEAPFEYIRANVYPIRKLNKRPTYRERWWLLAESRSGMRMALSGLKRYMATSLVSKHHFFQWVPIEVLPANLLIVIARDDDYFFGVLHSRIHELWARGTGTQLREAESGCRYTPTTTFETFPFPWPPGHEPAEDPRVQAIAQAAKDLVDKRDRWLNPIGASESDLKKRTLTNLYNERPMWLQLAHERLDHAVLDAYGWPYDLGDDELLGQLLALNLERAGAQ